MQGRNYILIFVTLFLGTSAAAQPKSQVRQMAYADSARMVEIFKDLHQNPELAFMEVRTAGVIEKELRALGYEVITGIGKTGLVGILRNGAGPTVMYRADMDCNSVKEATGLPYASTKTMKKPDGTETPVMHACGHDAHVTWMLAAARMMANMKKEWKGTLVMLAQPAEEVLLGAKAMVDDNMYAKGVPVPDYLLGLHTWPLPVGTIENGPGVRMSGSDQLDVTFHGIGGHGSSPEMTKDPVVMACNAVMQYQTIISRNVAAQDVAVLTVGSITAGTDNNVIPASATVKLNLRWFSEKTRNTLLEGINRINEGIAIANGLSKDKYPTVVMKGNVFPLENDTAFTAKINRALDGQAIAPGHIVINAPSSMGSEDFHHLIRGNGKTVYNYIKVGIVDQPVWDNAMREGKRWPYLAHSGTYLVDLKSIPLGAVIGTTALLEAFKK